MTELAFRSNREGRVIDVGPSTATVRLEPEEADGVLAIVEWSFKPKAPAPPKHVHNHGTETFFVISGEIDFILADGVRKGAPGTSLHVPAGMPHTLGNSSDAPAHLLEIFSPGSLLGLVEDIGRILSAQGAPDIAKLVEVFRLHDSDIAPVQN